jgi:hypothetical protein
MRKESQILNMKNCSATRWLYRSKTVVACGGSRASPSVGFRGSRKHPMSSSIGTMQH